MLSRTLAEKRNGLSSTTAIAPRSDRRSTDRTSAPSIRTDPALTSYSRASSEMREVLPEPVPPTSASVVPARTRSDTSVRASAPASA
jgi:hypothetical protein